MMERLHSDRKTEYQDGDPVEFTLDGDITAVLVGKIRGISIRNIIDYWIIELSEPIEGYAFSIITLPHHFIRRAGSNEYFLCDPVVRD